MHKPKKPSELQTMSVTRAEEVGWGITPPCCLPRQFTWQSTVVWWPPLAVALSGEHTCVAFIRKLSGYETLTGIPVATGLVVLLLCALHPNWPACRSSGTSSEALSHASCSIQRPSWKKTPKRKWKWVFIQESTGPWGLCCVLVGAGTQQLITRHGLQLQPEPVSTARVPIMLSLWAAVDGSEACSKQPGWRQQSGVFTLTLNIVLKDFAVRIKHTHVFLLTGGHVQTTLAAALRYENYRCFELAVPQQLGCQVPSQLCFICWLKTARVGRRVENRGISLTER